MQFGSDSDIYKSDSSDVCNVNQWGLHNSTADTCIQLYIHSSRYIICVLVIWYLNDQNI